MTLNMPDGTARSFEAVIFDMDGVIVDSEPIHEAAQAKIFSEYDLPVPDSEYMTFKGRPERDVFASVLSRYDAEGRIDPAEILARKHHVYQEMLVEAKPVSGALESIDRIRKHARIGLVTSSALPEQQRVFSLLHLDGEFQVIVTADDIERAKPHPDPYLKALRRMNVDPSSTMVIEDSLLGIESGASAGCFVVGLVGTFGREDLEASHAHLVIDTFEELNEMWGNPNIGTS